MKTERVITSKEDRKRIAEAYGMKPAILSKAMLFTSNSMLARKARCFAVNILGCQVHIRKYHLIEPKK